MQQVQKLENDREKERMKIIMLKCIQAEKCDGRQLTFHNS